MIEILVGLCIIFLLLCFWRSGIYLLEFIKLIGIIVIIATGITTVLIAAYHIVCKGDYVNGLLKKKEVNINGINLIKID